MNLIHRKPHQTTLYHNEILSIEFNKIEHLLIKQHRILAADKLGLWLVKKARREIEEDKLVSLVRTRKEEVTPSIQLILLKLIITRLLIRKYQTNLAHRYIRLLLKLINNLIASSSLAHINLKIQQFHEPKPFRNSQIWQNKRQL